MVGEKAKSHVGANARSCCRKWKNQLVTDDTAEQTASCKHPFIIKWKGVYKNTSRSYERIRLEMQLLFWLMRVTAPGPPNKQQQTPVGACYVSSTLARFLPLTTTLHRSNHS